MKIGLNTAEVMGIQTIGFAFLIGCFDKAVMWEYILYVAICGALLMLLRYFEEKKQ